MFIFVRPHPAAHSNRQCHRIASVHADEEFVVTSPYTAVIAVLAVAVAVTVALLVAVLAGLLARADGASHATAISRGGMTFATTLTLVALVVTTVAELLT
ncbi:hypothetical protein [Streptomyces phaeochromogenes]|uniref:hypothetical protein n=1 Tax=Streptomyces phaeochromogenes TaxID=1923 RepID=UPI00371AEE2B